MDLVCPCILCMCNIWTSEFTFALQGMPEGQERILIASTWTWRLFKQFHLKCGRCIARCRPCPWETPLVDVLEAAWNELCKSTNSTWTQHDKYNIAPKIVKTYNINDHQSINEWIVCKKYKCCDQVCYLWKDLKQSYDHNTAPLATKTCKDGFSETGELLNCFASYGMKTTAVLRSQSFAPVMKGTPPSRMTKIYQSEVLQPTATNHSHSEQKKLSHPIQVISSVPPVKWFRAKLCPRAPESEKFGRVCKST